jgi:hypothetical protein
MEEPGQATEHVPVAMDPRAQTRRQGLGALDALPDHLLVHILSFLPIKQLCVVSCVSAAMHVFAAVFSLSLSPSTRRVVQVAYGADAVQEDELWLHLCLLGHRNELRFHYNWRYTCIQHTLGRSYDQTAEPAAYPSARYQGILASWHLYCSWYRRHVDLGNFTVDNPNVQRCAPSLSARIGPRRRASPRDRPSRGSLARVTSRSVRGALRVVSGFS